MASPLLHDRYLPQDTAIQLYHALIELQQLEEEGQERLHFSSENDKPSWGPQLTPTPSPPPSPPPPLSRLSPLKLRRIQRTFKQSAHCTGRRPRAPVTPPVSSRHSEAPRSPGTDVAKAIATRQAKSQVSTRRKHAMLTRSRARLGCTLWELDALGRRRKRVPHR